MRSYFGSLVLGVMVASVASPALANPTKGSVATYDKTDSHGKAGLLAWNWPDMFAGASHKKSEKAPAADAKPKAKQEEAKKPSKPEAHVAKASATKVFHLRSTPVLGVQDVATAVDFVSVLPGERFPLRATNGAGEPVTARWHADGGELAVGDHLSVWQAPLQAGVHHVTGVATVNGKKLKRTLTLVVTVPTANVHAGKLNGYPIGTYPRGFGQPASQLANRGTRDTYVVPTGFIELSSQTVKAPVSEHYELGDFAGKDNWVNGKKYIFLEPKVVEKLERLIFTLKSEGYHVTKIPLMSAYRSPFLNADIGNVTTLSRHTYGDAVDMIVGDYNGDGKSDRADADILMAAVTKLDKETPLVGGASLYRPNGAHGYFIHTDTRGSLVRW